MATENRSIKRYRILDGKNIAIGPGAAIYHVESTKTNITESPTLRESTYSSVITRGRVRELLDAALPTVSDFEAFLVDYFPDIDRRATSGTDRKNLTNILLRRHEPEVIHRCLYVACPERKEFLDTIISTTSKK